MPAADRQFVAGTVCQFDFRAAEPNSCLWNYLDDDTRISDLQLTLDRWTFLFTREQTEASVQVLQAKLSGIEPPPKLVFDNKGVVRNDPRKPTPDEFTPETLEKNAWLGWFDEANNPNMEKQGMKRLQKILDIAKAHNTLVIGYTPPIHPLYKAFLDTHTDFALICKRINTQINALTKSYDFYYTDFMDDPAFTNGQTMFHDTMHPTADITATMMQILYDQYGAHRHQ